MAPAVAKQDQLRNEDTICVSITATQGANGRGDGGARKGIAAIFNGDGNQIDELRNIIPNSPSLDLGVVARANANKPVFNLAKFAKLCKDNSGRPNAEALKLQKDFNDALDEYTAGGGMDMAEAITTSVLAWAKKHHGIYSTAGDHLWVDPDQVQVRPSNRTNGEPEVFNVIMAPVWG